MFLNKEIENLKEREVEEKEIDNSEEKKYIDNTLQRSFEVEKENKSPTSRVVSKKTKLKSPFSDYNINWGSSNSYKTFTTTTYGGS